MEGRKLKNSDALKFIFAGKSILTLDNAINALLITTLLPVKSLVTRVSTLTKLGITKIFKNADNFFFFLS